MARRVTPSQFNAMLRRAESQRRQAIQKINREIDRVNRANKKAVDDYNRQAKKAVDDYNREVRQHNARVRSNRQNLDRAIRRLEQEARKPTRVTYTVRSRTVYESYQRLNERYEAGAYPAHFNDALDLAEREASNSAELEAVLGEEPTDAGQELQLETDPALTETLSKVQNDLPDRWRGALYALSPRNPDAARHFCTSAREIFAKIFEVRAPDSAVRAAFGNCDLTPQGTPTRRAKIRYLLSRQSLTDEALEDFVDTDVDNILSLFTVFNEGTHGRAGAYGASQLVAIKTRVEDGMKFLLDLSAS